MECCLDASVGGALKIGYSLHACSCSSRLVLIYQVALDSLLRMGIPAGPMSAGLGQLELRSDQSAVCPTHRCTIVASLQPYL